jgi:serine/threonine-protein kinase RsbW
MYGIRFQTLYNHAPCGYLYAMEDGTLIDVNDTFLAFTGYSREEIIENKIQTFFP